MKRKLDSRKSSIDSREGDDRLLFDEGQIAEQEARNGLLQFDEVERLTRFYAPSGRFEATTDLICSLNRLAIQNMRASAGTLRKVPITITNTFHTPPPWQEVQDHMNRMCDYANAHWDKSGDHIEKALHLSAYFMWRLNWIHPFRDGNGRTSRAVSYLALGVGLRRELVGTPTIADQIVENRRPYYLALDEADKAWRSGQVRLASMEALISRLLMIQLSSA